LTKAEAKLIPAVYSATARRFGLWHVYVFARFYLTWVRSERDAQDVVTFLAAYQEDDRYPITAMPSIERVTNALAGWLPPEVNEDEPNEGVNRRPAQDEQEDQR
jgi:hypothetical protein